MKQFLSLTLQIAQSRSCHAVLLFTCVTIATAPTPVYSMDSSPSERMEIREHVNRGNMLLGRRRFQEAIGEYEAALRIDPNNQIAKDNIVLTHNNWGSYLYSLRRYKEAKTQWTTASTLNPSDPRVKHNLVLLEEHMRRAGISDDEEEEKEEKEKPKESVGPPDWQKMKAEKLAEEQALIDRKNAEIEKARRDAQAEIDRAQQQVKARSLDPAPVNNSSDAESLPPGSGAALILPSGSGAAIVSSGSSGATLLPSGSGASIVSSGSGATLIPSGSGATLVNSGSGSGAAILPKGSGATLLPSGGSEEESLPEGSGAALLPSGSGATILPKSAPPEPPKPTVYSSDGVDGTSMSATIISKPSPPPVTSTTNGEGISSYNTGYTSSVPGAQIVGSSTSKSNPSHQESGFTTRDKQSDPIGAGSSTASFTATNPDRTSAKAPIVFAQKEVSSKKPPKFDPTVQTEKFANQAAGPSDDAEVAGPDAGSDTVEKQLEEMEQKVYGKSNKGKPILKRLEKLEMDTSGKRGEGSVKDRLHRLKDVYGL